MTVQLICTFVLANAKADFFILHIWVSNDFRGSHILVYNCNDPIGLMSGQTQQTIVK